MELAKIEGKLLKSNPKKQLTITHALARLNAENQDLKHLAQRAVISYIRSVFLNKDKTVFKVNEIDLEKLSQSFGLLSAPQIEFLSQDQTKKVKNSKLNKLMEKIRAKKEQK